MAYTTGKSAIYERPLLEFLMPDFFSGFVGNKSRPHSVVRDKAYLHSKMFLKETIPIQYTHTQCLEIHPYIMDGEMVISLTDRSDSSNYTL